MPASSIPAELIAAYRAAVYRVVAGAEVFDFRIGEHSPPLARMLALSEHAGAAFVTAHNPFSQPQDAAVNQAANARLRAALGDLTELVFHASGLDASGEWPPEPGFLALGVPRAAARAVGQAFQQNAVVWIGADAVPELELLR